MKRRQFLTATAVSAAAPLLRAAERPPVQNPADLIDTNVYLAQWPVRHSWAAKPAQLLAKLRSHGVTAAWVGDFDAVLQTDIAGVNARLAETCAREGGGVLRPFGSVNPALPDWEDDVRRCHEVHRMDGVRLFPNYHGYALDDPRFMRLVELSAQRGILLQIVLSIEDDRSQNPLLPAPPVNAAPLPGVMQKFPRARVMLLNGTSRVFGNGTLLQRLVAAGNVSFEIATLEGVAGIERLLKATPGIRLAFGSHAPFYYFEAALLKLQESALTSAQLAAVRFGNARDALAPRL